MTVDHGDLEKQPVELEGGGATRGEDGERKGTPVRLRWSGLTFEVGAKKILDDVSGVVEGGEMLAVMGPSGAGKSTFLDVLCKRSRKAGTSGLITLDGSADLDVEREFSFVEQDDALLGVLTVRETIEYAARLSRQDLPRSSSIPERVEFTLRTLGLTSVSKNKIGNPLFRGVSGGQKRRVTIGCAVVGRKRVLVLDEPTSGLDSWAAGEVMGAIKRLAKKTGMIVVASIHQPNFEVFSLFDNLLLLAEGKVMYHGKTARLHSYLGEIGHPCPMYTNPADRAIELVNTDFDSDPDNRSDTGHEPAPEKMSSTKSAGGSSPTSEVSPMGKGAGKVERMREAWRRMERKYGVGMGSEGDESIDNRDGGGGGRTSSREPGNGSSNKVWFRPRRWNGRAAKEMEEDMPPPPAKGKVRNGGVLGKTMILTERNFLNYRRNVLAFGIRMGMYVGMGLMLATIWIRLGTSTDKINDRLSVFFFSVAFLGFMSVAGIPAFLEERAVFVRERGNGLYTPLPYILAHTLSILPFLFACTLLFSLISYWAIGLHSGGTAFFRFTAYLFLGVLAAEMQSVLIAAAVPIFVAALALASFLNGFWMCVQGYFIKATSLPRFWYYWAHWIDYETFAFQLLVRNDVRGLTFQCPVVNGSCLCPFESSLTPGQCALAGDDIVKNLGYQGANDGLYVGILLIIILFYRVMTWAVLVIRKK